MQLCTSTYMKNFKLKIYQESDYYFHYFLINEDN